MPELSLPEERYPAAIQATAARIATMGRIVVQDLLPEDLLAEVEWRLFLTAVGEMLKRPDESPNMLGPAALS
jgi:hypothetical protein